MDAQGLGRHLYRWNPTRVKGVQPIEQQGHAGNAWDSLLRQSQLFPYEGVVGALTIIETSSSASPCGMLATQTAVGDEEDVQ